MTTLLMAKIPADRLHLALPFINVDVGFRGPFMNHYKIRGKRPAKAYDAVFVCFWSKAVHIEVESDLSTEAVLAALKRFIGRRGLPKTIYNTTTPMRHT